MSKGDAGAWYAFSIGFEALRADGSLFTALQLRQSVSEQMIMPDGQPLPFFVDM